MILLASTSPQRSALLTRAGFAFRVVPTSCDEDAIDHPHPQACAVERARAKALAADRSGQAAEALVLGADTVVSLGLERLGKPRDRADAVAILQRLQGTTHLITTAHCLLAPAPAQDSQAAREAIGVALAKVTLKPMSADEIQAYVDSGESDGRAGAYAIQENGDRYVVDLDGEFDTVVGLNLAIVERLHHELCDAAPERI